MKLYTFMALGFSCRRYEMLMSVLLVYATRRTANCVVLATLIGMYQLWPLAYL